MNRERASQITSSPDMIKVTYNGNLVYIEEVNPTKDIASIHYLNRPKKSELVSISQLVEMK